MDSGMRPAARVPVTKRKKRKSIGTNFESQADIEAAKKEREVEELVELLPPAVSMQLLGGEAAVVQVPDPADGATKSVAGGEIAAM